MSGRKWFKLNTQVIEKITFSLDQKNVGEYDYYFATEIRTASPLSKYSINNQRKLYLIQDFESWLLPEDEVKRSYRFGFKNIVISNWLNEIVEKAGATATIIKNGFDFNYFSLSRAIESRNPQSIAMLYHTDKRKGCVYGIKAIEKLKKKYPNLEVTLFGVPERPTTLPEWINYIQRPDKEQHNSIYNNASIYLAPSAQEGWGLTVGEAMICGAAVVCSQALGFKEMIDDKENGLMTRIGDVDDICEKVSFLIENNQKRIEIAKRGNDSIKEFTWDNSFRKLKALIENKTIFR